MINYLDLEKVKFLHQNCGLDVWKYNERYTLNGEYFYYNSIQSDEKCGDVGLFPLLKEGDTRNYPLLCVSELMEFLPKGVFYLPTPTREECYIDIDLLGQTPCVYIKDINSKEDDYIEMFCDGNFIDNIYDCIVYLESFDN